MKPNVITPIANAQATGAGGGTFEATSDRTATYLSTAPENGVIHHTKVVYTSDCTFSGSLKYFDQLGSRFAGYYPAPYGAQWATCQVSSGAAEDFTSGTTSTIGVPTSYTFYALEDQPDFLPYATDRQWVGGPITISNDHTASDGITLYFHPARTDAFPTAIYQTVPSLNWTQGSNGVITGTGSFSNTYTGSGLCGQFCDPGSTFVTKGSARFQVTPPSNSNNQPDFSLSCNPPSSKLLPGNTGQTQCSVGSIGGFNQPVSLSCNSIVGTSVGITCGFSPSSVTPSSGGTAQSTLVISTEPSTPVGAHSLTITGTSGIITHQTTVTVQCATCFGPRTQPQTTSQQGKNFILASEGFAGNHKHPLPNCFPLALLPMNCKLAQTSATPYGLYDDSNGFCTEGFGHLVKTASCDHTDVANNHQQFGAGMTQLQALSLFDSDVAAVEKFVNQNLQVQLEQWQFDALVDLKFNVAPTTFLGAKGSPLIADINSGNCDPAKIQADFALMPGDHNRRAAEANMFNNGVYPSS